MLSPRMKHYIGEAKARTKWKRHFQLVGPGVARLSGGQGVAPVLTLVDGAFRLCRRRDLDDHHAGERFTDRDRAIRAWASECVAVERVNQTFVRVIRVRPNNGQGPYPLETKQ